MLIPINNVNCLLATLESVFYEWEQDPILFVRAVEESADMTRLVDLGTSKRNGRRVLLHSISLDGNAAIPPTAKKYSRLLRLIITRTITKARSSSFADNCLLDSAIVELLLVTLDPVFRLRRKNIEKLSLAGRDHFNHLCDHVLWIESPLWFTEQPVDHFLKGFALDKVHVIAEPA